MDHGPIARNPGWGVERLDLDAYLARVGYGGPREPSLTALHGLQRAHQAAIPFENVTALVGDGVPLDLEALQAKMVRRRRGGYCHEHVLLFAAVLERLGFGVARLAARVRPWAPRALPRGHLLLATEVDGRRLVCDVGFGSAVLGPLPLEPGTTRQGEWEYRLERHGPEWLLMERGAGEWADLHVFSEEPLLPADVEVANHYVATSPHSPFARGLIVMRVEETVRRSLLGRTLATEHPDGRREERELSTDEALAALRDVFAVHLDEGEEAALRAHLAGTHGPDRTSPGRATDRGASPLFSDAHLAYLSDQILGRLATLGPDGPQVRPTGFAVDAEAGVIEIGGRDLPATQKWRNVRADGRVAFVVDDLASTDPWRPRALEVRGTAEALSVAEGAARDVIRITPERVLAMGLDE